MTINIRKNVFETNSSSSHSVTMHFPFGDVVGDTLKTIKPDKHGNITLNGGDFASTEINMDSPIIKANFVATHIMVYGDEKLKERFESVLKEHTGAKKIIYNIQFTYVNGKKANTFFSPEYSYPEDCGYYGEDYGEDDDYDEDEIDEKQSNPVSFKDILNDSEKLKIFLFHDEASIDSEISYG